MKDGIIRLGDKTSGGGQVISASGSSFLAGGKPIALLGDQATCQQHKNVQTFVEACEGNTLDGKGWVIEGCKLSCGCVALSSYAHQFMVEDCIGPSSSASQQFSAFSQHRLDTGFSPRFQPNRAVDEAFNDRFRLVDDMGQPLAHCEYVVRRANGQSEYGVTDAQGYTHLVGNTNDAEGVRIELGNWEDSNER